MIEKCFMCDGKGTQQNVKNIEELLVRPFGTIIFETIPCSRCLGSGAVDYRIVDTSNVVCAPLDTNKDKI